MEFQTFALVSFSARAHPFNLPSNTTGVGLLTSRWGQKGLSIFPWGRSAATRLGIRRREEGAMYPWPGSTQDSLVRRPLGQAHFSLRPRNSPHRRPLKIGRRLDPDQDFGAMPAPAFLQVKSYSRDHPLESHSH